MDRWIRPTTIIPALAFAAPHPLAHLLQAFCGGVFIELLAYAMAFDIRRKVVRKHETVTTIKYPVRSDDGGSAGDEPNNDTTTTAEPIRPAVSEKPSTEGPE